MHPNATGIRRISLLLIASLALTAGAAERISRPDEPLMPEQPTVNADGTIVAYLGSSVSVDGFQFQHPIIVDRRTGARQALIPGPATQWSMIYTASPSLSGDGRWLVFTSTARYDSSAGGIRDTPQVLLHDRQTATTRLVSRNASGAEANGYSWQPRISADGRMVVFASYASNLSATDPNAETDLFIFDRVAGTTGRIDLTAHFDPAHNVQFTKPSISGDGRYVAFQARNSVFVIDRVSGALDRIAQGAGGWDVHAGDPAITPDGRFVAFTALTSPFETPLAPEDDNDQPDVFVRDRVLGRTLMASTTAYGEGARYRDSSSWPDHWNPATISADGRFVAFKSDAQNLAFNDPFDTDVFVKDLQTGDIQRINRLPDGTYGDSNSRDGQDHAVISGTGGVVAFRTVEELSESDNEKQDIYAVVHVPKPTTPFSARVNFQPAGSPTVPGYLVDSGAVFGERGNGRRYGWTTLNNQTRDRNAANAPDQRYDTMILMQTAVNPDAVWEMEVPAGSYRLHAVLGDPSFFDGNIVLLAEGTEVARGRCTSMQPWIDARRVVTVTDGRLTLRCGPGSYNSKLCFIELEPLPEFTGLRVNMQPAAAPTVAGWQVDAGLAYGERGNGFAYGWNARIDHLTRDRNHPTSPDQRHDTLIHMQAPTHPGMFWEVALPNGWYDLRVVGGDPAYADSSNEFRAEGAYLYFIDYTDHWGESGGHVEVVDGRLTLDSATWAQNNKLCFLEIVPLPPMPTGIN